MLVRELATCPAVTCGPKATVTEVARQLRETDAGCVVVVDDEAQPLGICTDRDLVIRCLSEAWPHETPIECVMTRGVITLRADADIPRADDLLGTWGFRRLPMVNDEGRVAGVVTLDDLAVHFAAQLDRVVGVIRSERRAHTDRRRPGCVRSRSSPTSRVRSHTSGFAASPATGRPSAPPDHWSASVRGRSRSSTGPTWRARPSPPRSRRFDGT
jgi:CBS domain-containing protein